MTREDAQELKPCPFCGQTKADLYGGFGEEVWVGCDNPECDASGPSKDSDADAIAAWNRRAK